MEAPDRIGDMDEITQAIREYLAYVKEVLVGAGGSGFDIDSLAQKTTGNIAAYLPPRGRTWLARGPDGALVGMVYLKMIGPETAEIKRLYVRPEGRGGGLGRRLAQCAIDGARDLGAARVNLDTLAAMTAARTLYEGLGFDYVDPYPESEIDEAHRSWAVFMSRAL
jgi:GNAT superfamily N-acetyltransferase